MKILLVHNSYQEPGGEDAVFEREHRLLEDAGHEVVTYQRDNVEIETYSPTQRVMLIGRTVWAKGSKREVAQLIRETKPSVAHFHNTFPLISPSAYYACREAGVPVVQSLHNPRLSCPAASFLRDHQACQACLGKKFAWPAVVHGCYRDSHAQSGVVAAMLGVHWQLGTWEKMVDRYIIFSQFYKRKFVEAGLPPDKLVIKPHFVEDHGCRDGSGKYALFVGRLAYYKGIETLLEAWKLVPHIPLKIRGDGPLESLVKRVAAESGGKIEIIPRLGRQELATLMQGARWLIAPSEGFYETFGLVAPEAFSCGVPVVASRIGVMEEIVHDHRTGLHFNPGNAGDLARKCAWAWEHPEQMQEMGRTARIEYEMKYTASANYGLLMNIYNDARMSYTAA